MSIKKMAYAGGAGAMIVGLLATSIVFAREEGSKQMDEAKKVGSTLEVHVTDKGKALVRGAKVTGVNGDVITATTAWGSASVTWTVKTTSSTEFVRRFGGSSKASEISTGDFISFMGTVDSTAGAFTVNASVVKNWSVQTARANVAGAVKSIDAGGLSFVVTSASKGDVTVKTSSSTMFKKGTTTAAFSDVAIGGKVEADGLYNNVTKTLTAEKVKIQK